jgi:hypothetical protein
MGGKPSGVANTELNLSSNACTSGGIMAGSVLGASWNKYQLE